QFTASPPKTGAEALSTVGSRVDTVVQFLACGQEAQFADGATLRKRPDDKPRFDDAEDISEGMMHMVLAKMIVVSTWPHDASAIPAGTPPLCRQHVEFFKLKPKRNASDPDVPDTGDLHFDQIQQHIVDLFGGDCAGIIGTTSIGSDGLVKVDYAV